MPIPQSLQLHQSPKHDHPNNNIQKQLQQILTKVYKSAQQIVNEECLEQLAIIIDEATTKQQTLINCIQTTLFLLLQQIETLTQHSLEHEPTQYQILEQSLQKAESEVRKHIRIEQQLKLYLDGLEEKNQQLQKQLKVQQQKFMQLFETVKVMDQEKKQLLKKIKKLQEKTKFVNDRQINNSKLKPHKSAKLITQGPYLRAQQLYKSRPTLNNHLHSKSKMSDKSSQKQHKPTKSINEKKTKLKQLDDMIEVNLSNDVNRDDIEGGTHNPNDDTFIPTEEDVRIFRQMTKTVQMKQAYKRPVRKITKYRTESKQGKQFKQPKHPNHLQSEHENRQYRSVSMYK